VHVGLEELAKVRERVALYSLERMAIDHVWPLSPTPGFLGVMTALKKAANTTWTCGPNLTENMATYDQIRKDVQQKHGRYVQDCWIAHVKEQNGLPLRAAHNRRSIDCRAKPCPADVKPMIEATMRRFGMIR
jgi:hypothetical protein